MPSSPFEVPSSSDSNDSPLFCPICNDSMVSLSQLNQHLDDSHELYSTSIILNDKTQSRSNEFTAKNSNHDSEEINQTALVLGWIKKTSQKMSLAVKSVSRSSSIGEGLHNTLLNDSRDLNSNLSTPVSGLSLGKENSNLLKGPGVPGGVPFLESDLSRSHWQKEASGLGSIDTCFDKRCKKALGLLTGKINCRK